MVEQTEALCDLWEGTSAVLPLHSRLYHLEPIGVGSPMVESLTGYVKRLAEAHCVSVRALIRGEILPLCQRSAAYRNEQIDSGYITGYLRSSLTLNGPNILARAMVQALERLTLSQNLRFLTMLPWCGILSTNKLLRRMQAWCPTCYEEWRERGQLVYEPLLWALNDVKVCPRHHVQLQTQCRCSQAQPPLASRSLAGCCSRCGRWLGVLPQSRAERLDIVEENELDRQLWVANSVGELLSNAPSLLELPNRDLLLSAIKDYAEKLTGGSINKLTNQIRLRAIPGWIYAKETPQLGSLLQFCFALGASPFRLLTGKVEESAAANALKDTPMKQPRKFDARKLQLALEAVLLNSEDPPPSMAEVARRLEFPPEQLSLYFPDLCRAISARNEANPVFERHSQEAAVHSKTARELSRRFDTDRLRLTLEAVLQEDQPPSMSEVARRLEHPIIRLRKHFPELCRAISAKYKEAQKAKSVKRVLRIRDEVRQAMFSIHAQGQYPSDHKLGKYLNPPSIRREPEVRAVWRETLKELGWRQ